MRHTTIN